MTLKEIISGIKKRKMRLIGIASFVFLIALLLSLAWFFRIFPLGWSKLASFLNLFIQVAEEPEFFLEPGSANFDLKSFFDVVVGLDSKGASVSAVDVIIKYDPTRLKVIDADPLALGIQIETKKDVFPYYPYNETDASQGEIKFAGLAFDQANQRPSPSFSGRAEMAVIHFQALETAGQTLVSFLFINKGSSLDSNMVDSQTNKDILGLTKNASLSLEASLPQYPDFKGEYFANKDLKAGPVLVRNDPKIDFSWEANSPSASLSRDYFSVRWTGSFGFEKGNYLFKIVTDDGMRVWLDQKLILDHWKLQPPTFYQSPSVFLEQGKHELIVEYFENTGLATAKFWWEKVQISATPILIRAKGSPARGQWPEMRLRINNEEAKIFKVASATFSDFLYSFPKEIAYPLKIEIVFTNDDFVSTAEDRNLYVDYLKIGDRVFQAEDRSWAVYDRGLPWNWQTTSFDNLDVIEAREDLLWSGALRFIINY